MGRIVVSVLFYRVIALMEAAVLEATKCVQEYRISRKMLDI